ncbi:TetR/AcrR family transcriptional regulator [Phenylobacterium sp.]|uniref:TetR/AcrR family transcriptional regulator n=1 Tax=Phenylobacterium sp. TaxID=1871053 RepID=UPI0028113B0A|nr:TetR/AcrR family transcriptional regulator [Phenylobacterium sp.]
MSTGEGRTRLPREARNRQLMDAAWKLVRDEGTEALTLGRLAEVAGVTKPVVYDHFGTRAGLLAALYGDFEARQTQIMEAEMSGAAPTLEARAHAIAAAYVDCVLAQGRELPGVVAALASSPALEAIRRAAEADFLSKCRALLEPFAPGGALTPAGLRGMLGAAEALSYAAAAGELEPQAAKDELAALIEAMVRRARA